MGTKDWILIVATFLACFAGSGFGAFLTNRYAGKLNEKVQKEAEQNRAHERLKEINRLVNEYSDFLNLPEFQAVACYYDSSSLKDGTEEIHRFIVSLERKRLALSIEQAPYINYFDQDDPYTTLFSVFNNHFNNFALIANHPEKFEDVSDLTLENSFAGMKAAINGLRKRLMVDLH